ncbi:MAG: glycosyltransferase family A protein [Acidimicrobiales bacterium]
MIETADLPLVTVVVPAHDAEAYLAEALDSALRQTWSPVEIVVVDDGSRDRTADVAAAATGVKLLRQPNRGPAAARNAAVARATGDVVAYLDADDIWPADKLEVQVGYLLRNPECDAVLGREEVLRTDGVEPPPWVQRLDGGEVADSLSLVTMVLWRRVLDRVGPFDESFRVSEDMEWLVRARALGVRVDRVDEVVLRRRIHGANLSYRADEQRQGLFRALRGRARRDRGDAH